MMNPTVAIDVVGFVFICMLAGVGMWEIVRQIAKILWGGDC